MSISDRTFFVTVSLFITAAIGSTAYTFLVTKDYDFVVEAPCDAVRETCFSRDCSDGECPPNGLEHYRIFSVRAGDFSKCADGSCLPECTDGTITCTETVCGESEEDACAESPE